MSAHIRFGPNDDDDDKPQRPKSAVAHICDTIGWIVFFALCFAYCCREQIWR